jgi:hypothetical protein
VYPNCCNNKGGSAKRSRPLKNWIELLLCGRGFLDLAVSDAPCADAQTPSSAIHQGVNRLQVQIPTPLRHVMCVADPVSKLRPPAAHFTYFRHTEVSPVRRMPGVVNH